MYGFQDESGNVRGETKPRSNSGTGDARTTPVYGSQRPYSGHLYTCAWGIVISPIIRRDFLSCYDSVMRDLVVLLIHFIASLARLFGPGGARSLVAESLLLKHQLLILNRSRQRAPNLSASDQILAGWLSLWLRPTRLAFDPARPSPSHVQAKVRHAVLLL